jgi:hypothetical protein
LSRNEGEEGGTVTRVGGAVHATHAVWQPRVEHSELVEQRGHGEHHVIVLHAHGGVQ